MKKIKTPVLKNFAGTALMVKTETGEEEATLPSVLKIFLNTLDISYLQKLRGVSMADMLMSNKIYDHMSEDDAMEIEDTDHAWIVEIFEAMGPLAFGRNAPMILAALHDLED